MDGHYDDSSEALVNPVDVSEVEALLAAGPRQFLRDGRRFTHLLERMRMTLQEHRRQTLSFERYLATQSETLRRTGMPTTLNPMDAIRFLDDEQKEILFDAIAREQIQMLRDLVRTAQEERAAVDEQLTLVREVATNLAQMPEIPPHVRAEVAGLLAGLPREVAPVSEPALIKQPDPERPQPRTAQHSPPPLPADCSDTNSGGSSESAPVYIDPYGPAPSATAEEIIYSDPYGPARVSTGSKG